MGTATVIGRDELGRIIDVQVTTEADIAPPGPETVSAVAGTEQIIRSYTTTLTNAQVKTLRATSVMVVPDPGAGQVIDFIRIYLVSNITTAYTNIDAGSYVYFLLDRGGASTTDLQSFVNNSTALASGSSALLSGTFGLLKASSVISVSPGIDVDQATSGTGQPIQTIPLDDLAGGLAIKMSNSGDLTGGHADNTLSVTTLYTVLTL